MYYQIVLQFPFPDDYDSLIDLEDALVEDLPDSVDVDGHDAGSGEMNIFILTEDPTETFSLCKSIIAEKGLLEKLSAAYRPLDEEEYIRLWPEGSSDEFYVV